MFIVQKCPDDVLLLYIFYMKYTSDGHYFHTISPHKAILQKMGRVSKQFQFKTWQIQHKTAKEHINVISYKKKKLIFNVSKNIDQRNVF